MKTFLVTAAAGDTGAPTVRFLREKGHNVRALVRRDDARAQKLRDLGAEVIVADLLKLKEVRPAVDGVDGAYLCYPLADGLVEVTTVFAQAAREAKVGHVVNMSHKQARPNAHSQQTLNHWLSEQVLSWAGISTTHLRVTFFTEWLLYTAHLLKEGRYVTPFDPDSRFAPMAGVDIARVAAGILENPKLHVGQAYGSLFESYTARLIPSIEKRGLGAMVAIVPPGKRAVAYHLHHAEDEMYVILDGEGTARIADELIPVRAGDVIYTPAGREYAHQIINTSDKDLRYLSIGTHAPADICEYPDCGKFMLYSSSANGAPLVAIQRPEANLAYWDGEPGGDAS